MTDGYSMSGSQANSVALKPAGTSRGGKRFSVAGPVWGCWAAARAKKPTAAPATTTSDLDFHGIASIEHPLQMASELASSPVADNPAREKREGATPHRVRYNRSTAVGQEKNRPARQVFARGVN